MKSLGSFHFPPEIRGNDATTPEITAQQGGITGDFLLWMMSEIKHYCRPSTRWRTIPSENMLFSNKMNENTSPSLAMILFPEDAYKCSHDTCCGNLSDSSAKASTQWQGQPFSTVHSIQISWRRHTGKDTKWAKCFPNIPPLVYVSPSLSLSSNLYLCFKESHLSPQANVYQWLISITFHSLFIPMHARTWQMCGQIQCFFIWCYNPALLACSIDEPDLEADEKS